MRKLRLSPTKALDWSAAAVHAWTIAAAPVVWLGSATVGALFEQYRPEAASIAGLAAIATALGVTRHLTNRSNQKRLDKVLTARSELHRASAKLADAITRYRANPSRELMNEVNNMDASHSLAICKVAVASFEEIKPSYAPFSANIKHVLMADPEKVGKPVPCFAYVCSTIEEESERGKLLATMKGHHVPISACYWYDQMFKTDFEEDFFSHTDRRQLAQFLDENKSRNNKKAMQDFFLSWIAYPIYGKIDESLRVSKDEYFYSSSDGPKLVAGILCVDTEKAGAFGSVRDVDPRDIAIMEELCGGGFMSHLAVRDVIAAEHAAAERVATVAK